jgi:hypothetical protein
LVADRWRRELFMATIEDRAAFFHNDGSDGTPLHNLRGHR